MQYTATAAASTTHQNHEYSPPSAVVHQFAQVAKSKRLLRDAQKRKREFSANVLDFARIEYYLRVGAGGLTLDEFTRRYTREQRALLNAEIQLAKEDLRQAKTEAVGSARLFDYSELNRTKRAFGKRLKQVSSPRVLSVGKKKISASSFAAITASKLEQCSTLLVFRENEESSQLKYRNACRSRWCPVCQSAKSSQISRYLNDEIKSKVLELAGSEEGMRELKRGRLVHIVLTVKNVHIDQVGVIREAWRIIQKEKDKVFKRKENVHEVWTHAKWGVWKYETTYNAERGDFHDHLHLLVWVDGWLADSKKQTRVLYDDPSQFRKVKLKNRHLEKARSKKVSHAGWWQDMQRSWVAATKKVGLTAYKNGAKATKGAKLQHVGGVLFFTNRDFSQHFEGLDAKLAGATNEIGKYVSKSMNIESITDDDVLMQFIAKLQNAQTMNGFGGIRLTPTKAEKLKDREERKKEEAEQLENGKQYYEVVYRFNETSGIYAESTRFEWNQEAHEAFMSDVVMNWRMRPELIAQYEFYRRQLE